MTACLVQGFEDISIHRSVNEDPNFILQISRVVGFDMEGILSIEKALKEEKVDFPEIWQRIVRQADRNGNLDIVERVMNKRNERRKKESTTTRTTSTTDNHSRYSMLRKRINHLYEYLEESSKHIDQGEETFEAYRHGLKNIETQNFNFKEAKENLRVGDYRPSEVASLLKDLDAEHKALAGALKRWEDDLRSWILKLMYSHKATPPTEKEGYAAWLLNRILGENGLEL